MDESLVGKRVQVVFGEYDTQEPPVLPPGIIVRRLVGPDQSHYWLIELDVQVECRVWKDAHRYVLHKLVLAPSAMGDSLNRLFDVDNRSVVPVTIANPIVPFGSEAVQFDLSQVEYIARGYVARAGDRSPARAAGP